MEYELAMDLLNDGERATNAAWQGRLGSASSVAEVVILVHEFLDSWTAAEIARLPQDCQPRAMDSSDDIAYYAFLLVREQCAESGHTIELHRMATFFASASQRVSEILAIAKFGRSIRAIDISEWLQPAPVDRPGPDSGALLAADLRHRAAPFDVEPDQGREAIERVDELPIRHRQE
jgi:hypothetical protein